jgi:hypothetical protein
MSDPLQLPVVRVIKEMIPEILSPVVEALAELKAEYQVDRDEWIGRLDEIDEWLEELTRRVDRLERQLATDAGT